MALAIERLQIFDRNIGKVVSVGEERWF